MPNKTENFKLNQWEPEDDFLRADFNEDNAKLETALTELQTNAATCTKMTFGSYSGSYAKGTDTRTAITLGFRPKAVLSVRNDGRWYVNNDYCYGGMTYDGAPGACPIAITDTGFEVWNNHGVFNYLNHQSLRYIYIVFY